MKLTTEAILAAIKAKKQPTEEAPLEEDFFMDDEDLFNDLDEPEAAPQPENSRKARILDILKKGPTK